MPAPRPPQVTAYALMCGVYATAAVVAYGRVGDSVAGFLPDSLPNGPTKSAVGALLTFHILVAYLVTAQPLQKYICSLWPPSGARMVSVRSAGRARWLTISLAYLAFAYVLAVTIPFFADFQALLGAMTGAPIVFGWPAFFYLKACRDRGRPLARVDAVMCGLFLLVLLPLLTVGGTVSAISDIVRDAQAVKPFSC